MKQSLFFSIILVLSTPLFAATNNKLENTPKSVQNQQKQVAASPTDSKTEKAPTASPDNAQQTAKPATDSKTDASKKDEKTEEDPFASDSFVLPEAVTEQTKPKHKVDDPYIKYNRNAYRLNEKLDKYFAKPVATFYNKVMPRPLNSMIDKFFTNLENVPTVINDVLQGNFYQATSDTWRLTMNTTIGIGGLYDPAKHVGLEYNYEDFGLTLAKWGYSRSAYVVLPFLGPNSIRSSAGMIADYELFSVYPYIRNWKVRLALIGFYYLNQRAQLLKYQTLFNSATIDPYVFMRDAYLQRRAYLIQRNEELDNPNTVAETRAYHNPYYLYQ